MHEGAQSYPDRPRHHHFGVRVEHRAEIDAAWEYLTAHRDEYGLRQIDPQVVRHGSYSIHLQEPGTNFWEIECYEDVLRKDSGEERLGGVRSRHWDHADEDAPASARGYTPLAFTHGTLGATDADAYGHFVEAVLGLEAHRAYAAVRYIKHPATKHFVVALQVPEPQSFSPNFRFTIGLESAQAVEDAHAELAARRSEVGLTDLGSLEADGAGASFILRDVNGNWWELAA
ncbi:MAG: hypothetical protein GEU73_10385 [Chloroflexi bacterium]|nr:hypothetical protein [Chloroflexota bacterium]